MGRSEMIFHGLLSQLDGLAADETKGWDVVDWGHVTRAVPLETDAVDEPEDRNSNLINQNWLRSRQKCQICSNSNSRFSIV